MRGAVERLLPPGEPGALPTATHHARSPPSDPGASRLRRTRNGRLPLTHRLCSNPACQARAAECGAIETVAAALRRHPADPGVQWRGLGAQAVFAATNGGALHETLRRQRESGVADLVRLRHQKEKASVSERLVCFALAALRRAAAGSSLTDHGGRSPLPAQARAALARFPSETELLKEARAALDAASRPLVVVAAGMNGAAGGGMMPVGAAAAAGRGAGGGAAMHVAFA